MKLEEFVAETIRQVVAGVKLAQESVRGNDGIVNPAAGSSPSGGRQMITFDVALSTTEDREAKGGIGVFVGAFGLGTAGRSEASTASISRIQFTVPVELPSLPADHERSERSLRQHRAAVAASSPQPREAPSGPSEP